MRTSPLQPWLDARPAGDPSREYVQVRDIAGLFDASATRERLVLVGKDRLEFVQGLCTFDVEKLPVGGSAEAAFITPKGRLVATPRLTKLDDALLLEQDAGRNAPLVELLTKYRIHEECDWSDPSDDLAQLELWGPRTIEVLGQRLDENASTAIQLGEHAVLTVGTVFGAILFVPADAVVEVAEALLARLGAIGGGVVGSDAIEARRIALGLGKFGVDWDENTNPLEAGLDRALDYKKGCYVGQEVVAKATYIGHVNRRLVRLGWHGAPVARETVLVGGKSPGRVTSSAQEPGTSNVVALGVVRRDVAPAGSKVLVGEGGPEATVLGWPYGSKDKPV